MGKRIVIALGGNALGNTLTEQMVAVKYTAKAIADLIQEGHEVIVSHGNGPQVGMIHHAVNELTHVVEQDFPVIPLSVCVAMSQSYIGYDLQNALREELLNRGIPKPCATVITQVVVDPGDPAFQTPTKPIGRFMSEEEAKKLQKEKGYVMMEDAGRGWRRVVASPKPRDIVEIDTVRALFNAGQVVIAGGGGGIPVVREGSHLRGASAVIDKDFCSCLIAQQVDADMLIILTAVEKCAIHFGKPNQKWLDRITSEKARQYCAEGHFAPGSMLPKVEAAIKFAESAPGRRALITLLEKARDGIDGKTGTVIE
ncbi:MAG: carbamate kinase [Butyricicoccus sp.]